MGRVQDPVPEASFPYQADSDTAHKRDAPRGGWKHVGTVDAVGEPGEPGREGIWSGIGRLVSGRETLQEQNGRRKWPRWRRGGLTALASPEWPVGEAWPLARTIFGQPAGRAFVAARETPKTPTTLIRGWSMGFMQHHSGSGRRGRRAIRSTVVPPREMAESRRLRPGGGCIGRQRRDACL